MSSQWVTGPDAQWSQTGFPPGTAVEAFGVGGSIIYAGTDNGIYRSANQGASWSLANGNVGGGIIATSFAAKDDSLFIGTNGSGIGYSPDSGSHWGPIGSRGTGLANTFVPALGFKGAKLFAGTEAGIFQSTGSRTSWSPSGMLSDSILAFALSGSDLFIGTGRGVYRSSDDGVTWNPASAGLTDMRIQTLAFLGTKLFAGTLGGKVFRSGDKGLTWTLVNEGWACSRVRSFAVKGKSLFAGTLGGGVFFSSDTGVTWARINNGLTDTLVHPLAVNAGEVFAGTAHGGIFRYLGISPSVSAGTDRVVNENQPLTITVRGTDLDDDAVALSALNLPAGSAFSQVMGIFSWTPGYTQAGAYLLRFRGESANPLAADTDTVMVTVNNVDRPPVVTAGPDRIVDENHALGFSVTATDPDGDAVALTLLNPPAGATFAAGTFAWTPGFTQSGEYVLAFQGHANAFNDTDSVRVTVSNIDRPPRLDSLASKSIKEGDTLTFTLSANDPDGDPITFTMAWAKAGVPVPVPSGAGLTGSVFKWTTSYADSGHYDVSFIAKSMLLSDTLKMKITVIEVGNGLGTLHIASSLRGASLYAMPDGSHEGDPLGKDSAEFTGKPGIYWFAGAKSGYRTRYVPGRVMLHQSTSLQLDLKPSIPLWFSAPESLQVDGKPLLDSLGKVLAVADLDYDGKQDLMLNKGGEIQILRNVGSSDSALGPYSLSEKFKIGTTTGLASIAFVDWNEGGYYDMLAATEAGDVLLIHRNDRAFTDTLALKSFPGDSIRAWTMDWDGDGRKDIWIHSQGKGIFVYRNLGTDANPNLASASIEVLQADGGSLRSLASSPVWLDADNDGEKDMVAFQDGKLKIWNGKHIGGTLVLGVPRPMNIGGSEFHCTQCQLALHIGSQGLPSLLILPKGGAGVGVRTHLMGNLNADNVVDALDLGLLLDGWNKKASDPDWIPRFNLVLDPAGAEIIDSEDVRILESNWEMRE